MKPNPYDDQAFPVTVPPLVTYTQDGEIHERAVLLLAWRQSGPGVWEGLVTWVVTTRTEAGTIHHKHVEWVPADRLGQVSAEALRGRYKAVPRFK